MQMAALLLRTGLVLGVIKDANKKRQLPKSCEREGKTKPIDLTDGHIRKVPSPGGGHILSPDFRDSMVA